MQNPDKQRAKFQDTIEDANAPRAVSRQTDSPAAIQAAATLTNFEPSATSQPEGRSKCFDCVAPTLRQATSVPTLLELVWISELGSIIAIIVDVGVSFIELFTLQWTYKHLIPVPATSF